ncbi:MAG TPA: hypothetical protein PLV92_07885, partial [Pirellulaceae bacterium]|nr:hypothetical protein [Pirellulaceae bacterium]
MRRFRWNVLGVTVGGLVFVASTAVLPSSTSSSVAAQERDYSRRYDPKELVERLDQNKNGMVEPDEMQGRSRYFLERIAPQMGLDLTKPIPNDKLMEAVKNAPPREGSSGGPPGSGGPGGGPGSYGGPGSPGGPGGGGPGGYGGPGSSSGPGGSSSNSGSSGGGSSSSGRREEKAPLVPGFGAPSSLPKPPGFDGALAMATAAASSAESRYDRRVVEYVDRMMRDYDKNKDSQLDADEMKAVQWTGDPKESDTNRDGKLSRLELLDRIAKKWGSTTSPSSSSSGRSGSGFGSSSGSSSSSSGTSAADEAAKVRRYAEGLLKQYDANKNGVLDKDEWTQVRTITPDTDANKDGAVTIEELTAKLSGFGQQGAG